MRSARNWARPVLGIPASGVAGRGLLLALCLGSLALVEPKPARAQIFAPGALSKAHKDLEGMQNCTKCHAEGVQHDNNRCLDCHKEISTRIQANRGYHARLGAQLCAECHAEHRGIANKLFSLKGFNHTLTGWKLEGSHRKKQSDCKKCHEVRNVFEDDAKKLFNDGYQTYLGVSSQCRTCHFDEHRGQVGERCEKCHSSEKFQEAPKFNHRTMSDFPLTGHHKKVDCQKCHESLKDSESSADSYPKPRADEYMRFVDIPHESCVNCHQDVHKGEFGNSCTDCHSTKGWNIIDKKAKNTGFHDDFDFPLEGRHAKVACQSCHGPFPGQPAKFEGLAHANCVDCHVDAHHGQVAPNDDGVVACERCHSVNGFVPTLFDFRGHEETKLPLDGAHRAVPCTACHRQDDQLAQRIPQSVRNFLKSHDRKSLFSNSVLHPPNLRPLEGSTPEVLRCESCHADPHMGQFEEQVLKTGCNSCHVTTSFQDETFQHDTSRFPLEGQHRFVSCDACHPREKGAKRVSFVRYKPLDIECAACHIDEHVGQLARAPATGGPPQTDCQRCHSPVAFAPTSFRHDDPEQTDFVLEGKHREVECSKCHAAIRAPSVDNEDQFTVRYKPLPTDCASCHADEHDGSFDRFTP